MHPPSTTPPAHPPPRSLLACNQPKHEAKGMAHSILQRFQHHQAMTRTGCSSSSLTSSSCRRAAACKPSLPQQHQLRPAGATQLRSCDPVAQAEPVEQRIGASGAFASSFALYLLSAAAAPPAAVADVVDAAAASPFQGVTANSLYVTLALFLMTAPGALHVWGGVMAACVRARVRRTSRTSQGWLLHQLVSCWRPQLRRPPPPPP